MDNVKPISPDEVGSYLGVILPPEVIAAWNKLIALNFSNGSATIDQCDAIAALMAATGKTRDEVFDKGWLNIEPMYRAAGWKVVYDKPAYNESYEPTFTFTKR